MLRVMFYPPNLPNAWYLNVRHSDMPELALLLANRPRFSCSGRLAVGTLYKAELANFLDTEHSPASLLE